MQRPFAAPCICLLHAAQTGRDFAYVRNSATNASAVIGPPLGSIAADQTSSSSFGRPRLASAQRSVQSSSALDAESLLWLQEATRMLQDAEMVFQAHSRGYCAPLALHGNNSAYATRPITVVFGCVVLYSMPIPSAEAY